ncbi:hypothetical protein BP6252_03113 [Coleophoma cylindrospora]|uniref:Uncharacterized protein n=1 Tax=Coleophoma cylindrospora TaxID=1849047 RepID=A0A3D8S7E5_9HELO|nr:hypothetical protein BP6252_03113 [Coleophoma cylindrospora]
MPHYLLLSKTAVITGGTTGIGRAIALEFLKNGCNVAVNHLNQPTDLHHLESLVATAAELKQADEKTGELIEITGDVTDPLTGKELVRKAVERWGRLDVCTRAQPLGENRRHQPLGGLLHLPSSGAADGITDAARRLDHWDLVHLGAGGRRAPDALHADESRDHVADAEHGGGAGPVSDPVQRAVARHDQDAAERGGFGE